jgi:hypothetical protein
MGKRLAIKGHPTRGKKVIEILEMLGGNKKILSDADIGDILNPRVYFFDSDSSDNRIAWDYLLTLDHYGIASEMMIFTLEEFLEKYPFKIGDKVKVCVQDDEVFYGSYELKTIKSVRWNETFGKVAYTIEGIDRDFYKEELKPYKEEVNMKDNKLLGTASNPIETKSYTVSLKDGEVIDNSIDTAEFMQFGKMAAVCFNKENYEDEVELQFGDYKIEFRDGKTYAVRKKPKYPTTYDECFNVCFGNKHHIIQVVGLDGLGDNKELFESFIKLKICRDAYWKIYGEQMGLGKPWEPDWENGLSKFCIINCENRIIRGVYAFANTILAFPTEEMRDAFYENFKDLIEQCKELL